MKHANARLGSVLPGAYRLDRVLCTGEIAALYAATRRGREPVGVNVLHAELSIHGDIRSRFVSEAYAANLIDHPGAAAIVDDGVTDDGAGFVVTDRLDGTPVETLRERYRSRLPLALALSITHGLLDVLAAAHAVDVVHRDIRPAHLLVTAEGVKVLDFGIARVRDLIPSGGRAAGRGLLLGTPAFMAPELALGNTNDVDPRTDVWAVGATLFALLSGRSVHEGKTVAQVLVRAATAAAPRLGTLVPDLPWPVLALVDRALAYDRARRWPSAQAMREATRRAHLAVVGREAGGLHAALFRRLGAAAAPARTNLPPPSEVR
jgi:serine/threonine-protein kinase